VEVIGMNRDQFTGKWKRYIGKVKEHWGTVTDDLSLEVAGQSDQIAGRIQEQNAITKAHAKRQLNEFLYRNRNWNHL
jgi:uncharacterized protein YjbJ (UPF0337 family)